MLGEQAANPRREWTIPPAQSVDLKLRRSFILYHHLFGVFGPSKLKVFLLRKIARALNSSCSVFLA